MYKMTAGLIGLLAAASTGQAQQIFLIPPFEGLIEGISDNGVAAGSTGFGDEYFIWTVEAGSQQIGGETPGGGLGGQGKISVDGLFICGTTFNDVRGYHEMSRYDVTTGTWLGLGGLGGQSGSEISSGWAISGDGTSVGGLAWITPGSAHAAQWSGGVMNDLGSTVPGESTRLNAINYDGSVVGGWQDGAGRQGAVWVDGIQQLVFKNDSTPASEVFDLSGDGQWATGMGVGSFFAPGNAFRYHVPTDTYEDLPNLTVGAAQFMAGSGITDDGATIVGGTWGFGPATFGTAYIWREGIGTMPFSDFLDEQGVVYPDNYVFAFVSAISSNGEWIAGWGNMGTPASTASWVVQLATDDTPPDLVCSAELGACGVVVNFSAVDDMGGVTIDAVVETATGDVIVLDGDELCLGCAGGGGDDDDDDGADLSGPDASGRVSVSLDGWEAAPAGPAVASRRGDDDDDDSSSDGPDGTSDDDSSSDDGPFCDCIDVPGDMAVLFVTATDDAGNSSTCEIDLCFEFGGSGDDDDDDD